jgi:hypothetical protein
MITFNTQKQEYLMLRYWSILLKFMPRNRQANVSLSVYIYIYTYKGDRGSTVFRVLRFKSEGRWFDPRCCHWTFSLT